MRNFVLPLALLFCLCLDGALAMEDLNSFRQIAKDCGLDIKRLLFNPASAQADIPCAMLCALVKVGFMDKDGKLLTDAVVAMAPAEVQPKVKAVTEKCSAVKSSSPCEAAMRIGLCLLKEPVTKAFMQ